MGFLTRGRNDVKKWASVIRGFLFVIALAVFLFSAYKLYAIYAEYRKGEKEYEEVMENAITQDVIADENGETEEVIFSVDFKKLKATNKEVVAWVRFDNPVQISYPVLQGKDNAKYLNTTFEGKQNSAGAIFMDVANKNDFSNKNTILYGHNMKNRSMFGGLREYKQKAFYEENPYFYIYTPDGMEHKYQIFAVAIVEDTAVNYQKSFGNEQEFSTFLNQVQKKALYGTGVQVNSDSQVLTLSTCTNVTDTQRLVVHGVKIDERVMGETKWQINTK